MPARRTGSPDSRGPNSGVVILQPAPPTTLGPLPRDEQASWLRISENRHRRMAFGSSVPSISLACRGNMCQAHIANPRTCRAQAASDGSRRPLGVATVRCIHAASRAAGTHPARRRPLSRDLLTSRSRWSSPPCGTPLAGTSSAQTERRRTLRWTAGSARPVTSRGAS